MTDLGTLGGGSSVAYGINNSGTIVGYAYTSGGPQHAFSYSGGLMTDLGTLGGLNSQANAINSSGTIVGYAETSVGSHAFSYRGGVMIDLEPYLASIGMTGDSVATAINDNGDIVGYASLSNGINHAFLLQAMAPSITSQPQAQQTAVLGSTVAFVVITGGAQPLTYQWEFNGTNIAGATASSLTLTNVQAAQAGNYLVVVSNAWGCVSSWNAVLTVVPATTPGGATGTAVVLDGFVVAATIIDGGYGYTNTPTVKIISGGGSGADAVAVVSNGLVIAVNVMDAGYGYTNTPLVVIAPPSIPNPVLSIAPMSFLSFSNLTVGGLYQLQQSMAWYWSNQPVSFTATNSSYTQIVAGLAGSGDYRLALNPVPAQAFATAVVDYGFVVHATVTSGGSGYVTSPTITIVGGGGTNATAVSHISGGVVTGITIADAGIGYTNTPTVRIAPPPAAAVFSTVQPVIRVGSANLAPYNNYQIQFKPDLGGTWGNWNGGLFSPSGVTNSQYLFITNGVGFFRLKYVP
jgi:probable HAF family extracellular repeat protein